jgi:anti-anti-sigma factor
MRIEETRHGAVTVIRPIGPLIRSDAEQLRDQSRAAAERSLGRIVLDMDAVPYADSAGLEALADLAEEMAAAGRELKLTAVNETLREVFELTELAVLFEHYEDVGSAARSFL